jgi:hypothetical protein
MAVNACALDTREGATNPGIPSSQAANVTTCVGRHSHRLGGQGCLLASRWQAEGTLFVAFEP